MPIHRHFLSALLILCAASGAALAESTATESGTDSEFGNITTYRPYGGYDRSQQGGTNRGYGAGNYNGANGGGYNRYPDRSPGGYDDQYNRPRQQRGSVNEAPTSQLGAGPQSGQTTRNRNLDMGTRHTQRQRNSSNRMRGETAQEILRRYQVPGVKPLYRSPYDSSQYRGDRAARNYRGTQNPGYNQSNGNRETKPVKPLDEGALPEGANDDAHYITR